MVTPNVSLLSSSCSGEQFFCNKSNKILRLPARCPRAHDPPRRATPAGLTTASGDRPDARYVFVPAVVGASPRGRWLVDSHHSSTGIAAACPVELGLFGGHESIAQDLVTCAAAKMAVMYTGDQLDGESSASPVVTGVGDGVDILSALSAKKSGALVGVGT